MAIPPRCRRGVWSASPDAGRGAVAGELWLRSGDARRSPGGPSREPPGATTSRRGALTARGQPPSEGLAASAWFLNGSVSLKRA